ncbi:P-loop containing nucleoside triphosphate hydrolase protein [Yarrowia lipolytica]|uniref:P-loop containing nucleoside triphosphate hydrolase protein n=1 Tax=Yarrowia lipolytica TaxID=4952 RepID=A0A371C4R8_YARLL|nr:P-loop containing nucleoside triphosphate hydrolase protein [Yarrowia lipolytica]RDW38899.1 P-loop containing nucleoside triphosphate hydrolase protein [Yarrowia lipolytica]RDW44802.1 P-loop containing nucleoside triphosphate hydrolase protein [Yarrowia lipolytica]RDW51774.1 P-loop containing nucleoside triphosphate hydrolase protein [Yarrowia lipolytica]VBB84899.1 YALIH222S03e00782g1_1 [Yarrowia lipolytica]
MAVATPKRPQKRVRREPIRVPLKELEVNKGEDMGVQQVGEVDRGVSTEPLCLKRRKVECFEDDSVRVLSPPRESCDPFTDSSATSGSSFASPPPLHPHLVELNKIKSMFSRGSKGHILAADQEMVGRQVEEATLLRYFEGRLQAKYSQPGAALYVSGPPGTGKTALLQRVMDKVFRGKEGIKVASINCMLAPSARAIMNLIYKQLSGVEENEALSADISFDKSVAKLEELFMCQTSKEFAERGTSIVVLDEIDHIMTRDQDILFRIFEWAFCKGSRLILVGIANALDLTDRFLPRLKANNFYPQLLKFKPYDAVQIASIIKSRIVKASDEFSREHSSLKKEVVVKKEEDLIPSPLNTPKKTQIDPTTLTLTPPHTPTDKTPAVAPTTMAIHPAAIQLCARKASANTGDLRKAFDICRKALEISEQEFIQKLAQNDPSTVSKPVVSIATMARVCSQVFGGNNSQRIKMLNLQQKAVLCTVASAEKQLSIEAITSGVDVPLTIQRLFDHYTSSCKKHRMLSPLPFNEFLDVCSALESYSVINITGICGKKNLGINGKGRASKGGTGASKGEVYGIRDDYVQRKVTLNVQRMDIASAIEVEWLQKYL